MKDNDKGSTSSSSPEFMVKILLKENEQLKENFLRQKEYKDNITLSSLLEVLKTQRMKIDLIESENKQLGKNKQQLFEKLKGLEMKAKTQAFYSTSSNSKSISQRSMIDNNKSNATRYSGYNNNSIFQGLSIKKEPSLYDKDIILNKRKNQINCFDDGNQYENNEVLESYKLLPKKQKIKLITNNKNTIKQNEIQDKDISKIPFDYDNLINLSLNRSNNNQPSIK